LLPVPPAPSPWRLLAGPLVHFIPLLLWAAAGLAVIGGMPQLGVAIVAIVVLNGVFAFVGAHRAERAAKRLRGEFRVPGAARQMGPLGASRVLKLASGLQRPRAQSASR
jgi:magnesium-transporting ATPase (P-type)